MFIYRPIPYFCPVITDPQHILPLLKEKQVENIFFKKFLRNVPSASVDEKVKVLNAEVSSVVDCTQCANCCKQLEPGLDTHEIERLALRKEMMAEDFKQMYVAFDGESQFLKTKPCMFLDGHRCGIYEDRPGACAAYPHLDQPDIKYKRSVWSNYSICPIVFNVIEGLKQQVNFTYGA